jgi:hypothetical protein
VKYASDFLCNVFRYRSVDPSSIRQRDLALLKRKGHYLIRNVSTLDSSHADPRMIDEVPGSFTSSSAMTSFRGRVRSALR